MNSQTMATATPMARPFFLLSTAAMLLSVVAMAVGIFLAKS